MEKISLVDFKIPFNYLLIKPDPDFEFIEVDPKVGFKVNNEPVKIWIGYNTETHARHFGITGKVIAIPDRLVFNGQKVENYKKQIGSVRTVSDQIAIADLMSASQEIDVDMEVITGDKVWFSYLCQLNAVTNQLLVDTVEQGMCFLVKYEDLYCYERKGEVSLVNGWVWIQRVKRETKTAFGIELQVAEKNQFINGRAMIIKSGNPVKAYIDGSREDTTGFNGGEQVIYNSKAGHPIEYGMHRKLHDDEVYSIRRKHIYAII